MANNIIYVVTRNANGIYTSVDEGATFIQASTTALTSEVNDIALGDRLSSDSVITYGDGINTTPYYSSDNGATYQPGQNTFGKEVTYVGQSTYVFGSTNSATGSGSRLGMSFDNGQTINVTIDVAPLFDYAGSVYNNITVTSFDFLNSAGGYITIAGDQNNASADQILTRTFDRGQSFPDALVLPGTMGIIRGVWASPEKNVVFAIGDPDSVRGSLYSINPSLTEAPVPVLLGGVTVGSVANNLTVKFASVPPTYNTDPNMDDPNIDYIEYRSKVYFLDSAGKLFYSNDSGLSWQLRSTLPGICVDIVALSENIVLVLSKTPAAVLKSVDGGRTFVSNPQPSWIDAKAISATPITECDKCNAAFSTFVGVVGDCYREDRLVGTLCKPPYIYSEFLGACAKPSTIVPMNIVIAIDHSASVTRPFDPNNPGDLVYELPLFKSLIQLLITKLEDRLLDQSMKIAVVGWSSNACIQQDFTSDINAIRIAINTNPPTDLCNDNGTNHTDINCVAIRLLNDASVARPDAKNVLLLFTDGADGVNPENGVRRNCDLSDIGLLPIVLSDSPDMNGNWSDLVFFGQSNMYQLVKNAKEQLNNGIGFTYITTIIGSQAERGYAEFFLLGYPVIRSAYGLGPEYIIPSEIPNRPGNYYLLDAGYFDNADFIADQIRLGLAGEVVSSPVCPEGCEPKPGVDGLGYCMCYERYSSTPCANKIQNCITGETVNVISVFITLDLGLVIKLRPQGAADSDNNPFFYDGGNDCWNVIETGIASAEFFYIRPQAITYDSCPACIAPPPQPWYQLTDCFENTFIIYTQNSEFQTLLDAGTTVITHNNYPDRCLLIENVGSDNIYEESGITPAGIDFTGQGCQSCPREVVINYKLTNCNDQTDVIYCAGATNDLQSYIGQYVNIQDFGSRCWLVETDTEIQAIYQDVIVTRAYSDCEACTPVTSYIFTNCEDNNVTINTRQDFSQYVGLTVTLSEYPGNCWVCTDVPNALPNPQLVTLSGPPYLDCPSCLVRYYQLTNCANEDVYLISSTNLLPYLGRVITAAGFPSLCFTVSDPKCNCIKITVNGIEYNVNAEVNLFNGRKNYRFETEDGGQLAIAWNSNPNRWELFNQNTLEIYGFSIKDSECPFANLWTIPQGSLYIITRVTFCPDDIYQIAPELDFANCIPCIKCI